MRALTVVFDDECPFCLRCARWLLGEPVHVALRLLPSRSEEARARFGGVVPGRGRYLVAVDERGVFWVGPGAFVLCLWALRRYRWLALICMEPPTARLALWFFEGLSQRRSVLSRLFAGGHRCGEGACGVGSSAYR